MNATSRRSGLSCTVGPSAAGVAIRSSARLPHVASASPIARGGRRQHDGFGEQLTHDAQASGAERQARRDLPLARVGSRQHQRRDVEAGEQQHGGEHEEQQAEPAFVARTQIARAAGGGGLQAEVVFARQAILGRIRGGREARLREDRLELRLGGLAGDTRLQPPHHVDPGRKRGVPQRWSFAEVRHGPHRHGDVVRPSHFGAEEARRLDAHDCERHRVELHGGAEDVGSPAESAHPEPVIQHGDGLARAIVLGTQQPSGGGRDPQRPVVVAGHVGALRRLTLTANLHRDTTEWIHREDAGQRRVLLRDPLEMRVGHGVVEPPARAAEGRHDEAIGLGHRQLAEHDAVEEREDGPGGADPERQRGNREQGEHRASPHQPDAVAHVEQEGVPLGACSRVADLFLERLGAAQRHARRPARLGARHAALDVLVDDQVEGRAELVGQLVVDPFAVHEIAPQAAESVECPHGFAISGVVGQ